MSDAMMNPFNYSNVVIGDNSRIKHHNVVKATAKMTEGGGPILGRVIATLAYDKPLWTFTASDTDYGGRIDKFTVTHDGEEVGTLKASYYRGSYCVEIQNHRIQAKRERGGGYRTADVTKAVMTAKKMFARKNTAETIKEATKKVEEVLSNESYGKQRTFRSAEHALDTELRMFAKKDETVQSMFTKHLIDLNKTHLATAFATAELEMVTIQNIKDAYENKKATVVLKVDGRYVVQVGDNVQFMDDNTLPENIRGKLGLLKLVEDEHTITDVGCRINSETFVLLADQEKQDEQ